jgi:hypothetical protein
MYLDAVDTCDYLLRPPEDGNLIPKIYVGLQICLPLIFSFLTNEWTFYFRILFNSPYIFAAVIRPSSGVHW